MSKAEKFALFTGIIGVISNLAALVASALTIMQVTGSLNQPTGHQESFSFEILIAAMLLVFMYCWFIIDWFIIRQYFNNVVKSSQNAESPSEDQLTKLAIRHIMSVTGTGLVLLPGIVLLFQFSSDPLAFFGSFLSTSVMGLGVWLAISLLMPVIYSDMDFESNVFFLVFREKDTSAKLSVSSYPQISQPKLKQEMKDALESQHKKLSRKHKGNSTPKKTEDKAREIVEALSRVIHDYEDWHIGRFLVSINLWNFESLDTLPKNIQATLFDKDENPTTNHNLLPLGWNDDAQNTYHYYWHYDESQLHLVGIAYQLIQANQVLGIASENIVVKLDDFAY